MATRSGRRSGGAERIEKRPVEALVPYARNARTHSEAQVGLIAGSIREFGFNNPVLVDKEKRHHRRARAGAGGASGWGWARCR